MIVKTLIDFKKTYFLEVLDDPFVATNGKLHDLNAIPGFVILKDGIVKGASH